MNDAPALRVVPWADFSSTRRSVLQAFLDGRPRTRSDIAAVIGQSLPSAAGHIDALESLELITTVTSRASNSKAFENPTFENPVSPGDRGTGRTAQGSTALAGPASPSRTATGSTGAGRPPAAWRLNPRAAAAIGIEIRPGGPRRASARIATRIVLLDGSVACEHERAVSWSELRKTRDLIHREALSIQQAPEAEDLPVMSLGVAIPGVVDCKRRLLIHAPNLFLSNVGFQDLEESLGMRVFVDNEANTAALAEYALCRFAPRESASGAQRSGDDRVGLGEAIAPLASESMVRISITEGVGAGILVDGALMRGDAWRAGEFGHMAIRDGSRPCNCGRTGCWEQYASEWALLADARAAGLRARTLKGILREVVAGEPHALSVWQSYVHALATGIENIAACIDPGTIVVGGKIASAGDLLVAPLRCEVESISFLTSGIQVDVSQLGPWSASLGAALLSFGNIFHSTKESVA